MLWVNDTTEIDLTRPRRQVTGAGPLDGGARRGVSLHLLHAFTPDGTPLGTVQAAAWVRDEAAPSNAWRSRAQRAATPIQDKESHRWLISLRRARDEAAGHPDTRVVYVADSEADIFEVIGEGMKGPRTADWLAAMLSSLRATRDWWGINPRSWLIGYLQACATAGGQAPADLKPFLP